MMAAQGRAQLLAYPTAAWANATVVSAAADGEQFRVTLFDGGSVAGRRLVLATGVADAQPQIEGLAQRWGKSAFHCPYCHGYEPDQGDIGARAGAATVAACRFLRKCFHSASNRALPHRTILAKSQ